MFDAAVLCCLLLSIVQATATTCPQQGTQECDQNLMIAACNGVRSTGESVPSVCPSPPPTYSSCLDLHLSNPSAPSGNYQIELSNGTMVNVYCDMDGTNCNGQRGWTRVAFVNMTQPGATCPTGLAQIQESGLTFCSRDSGNLVQSTVFPIHGLNYSSVCGRVRGYQFGQIFGFLSVFSEGLSITDNYVDGVSITRSMQHVWSYAGGLEDNGTSISDCPCNNGNNNNAPTFVGSNYYCESGTSFPQNEMLYVNDPLWDRMNCENRESTCCTGQQPWFNTALQESTTDDIELRVLGREAPETSGALLDMIELYIR